MILEEYDAEFHIANEKKLSYQEGLQQGIERGRQEQMALTEETIKAKDQEIADLKNQLAHLQGAK